MERHKKNRDPLLLLLGTTGIISISAYVNIFSPDTFVSIAGFFVLLTATFGVLGAYIFRRLQLAVLLTIGISSYLVLRYLGLRQPLYAALLIASVLALKYLWKENY